jgi:methionyl aminopeptidase
MGEIKNFKGLPFTTRWISNFGGRQKMAMQKLVKSGVVKSYDVLKDREDGLVAQAEHTVLVGVDDGDNIVTTRR